MELARRRLALNRLASHDPVTDLYRPGAFSTIVDRRRKIVDVDNPAGAFLVVHADHLSEVNRRYGLEAGDEALALIALAIRSSVRTGDVVGRIGATMFGVFLPGAEEGDARDIADRISASVTGVYFSPDGAPDAVSVRIGGVVFAEQIGFNDMFREAVERLYSEDPTEDSLAIALGALRLDTAYRH
ncbi:GGDEF domain-containing protein [Oricola thermophila]|uniref:diguanylate cyclase n=1 Tax=Oricola thermophila TaxID=2742145 RepID=A0A6N1VDP7_9HYPH|nr:GGDEF domain-containing protein [Oricola thermophila]QKV17735.1 GGDEF domain-containing protein [Oricola thermophila]